MNICQSCNAIHKGKNPNYCNKCKIVTRKCVICSNLHKTTKLDINQCTKCLNLQMDQYITYRGNILNNF